MTCCTYSNLAVPGTRVEQVSFSDPGSLGCSVTRLDLMHTAVPDTLMVHLAMVVGNLGKATSVLAVEDFAAIAGCTIDPRKSLADGSTQRRTNHFCEETKFYGDSSCSLSE